jgi:glyoxylase-like metal-dependent hydrolase (beta-lactamase superfamily II)
MKTFKEEHFGAVTSFNLGFGWIGRPLMTVRIYMVDGIMIDTGQSHMEEPVLKLVKEHRPNRIVLTHHHEDHSGNACFLRNRLGLPILGHPLTVLKMETRQKIRPYQRFVWGSAEPVSITPVPELIETKNCTFLPIHTPGHSKDHTVYLEKQKGWLFSGDLFLGDRIKFFRSDECLKKQILSIRKVLTYDFDALFCSHNPAPKNGKKRLEKKLEFLESIHQTILDLARKGYSENRIIKMLDPGKDRYVKWVTFGNASFANMIRSAIRSKESI